MQLLKKYAWCLWVVCLLHVVLSFAGGDKQALVSQGAITSIATKNDPMPEIRGEKYYNPASFGANEFSFFHGIKFLFKKLWDKICGNSSYVGKLYDWYAPVAPLKASVTPAIHWIGHATCLIQLNNFNILTDPVFGDISLIITYARSIPAGVKVDQLPPIDMILISHNHRDHLDIPSLELLVAQQPIVLVPVGVADLVRSVGYKNVREYTWWQQEHFTKNTGEQVVCTCVPASHGSGRTLFDFNKSLWSGWMVQSAGNTLYFAGDTAYNDILFAAIGRHFPVIHMAMLPIGPGNPRELMAKVHLNTDDAINVCKYLCPHIFVPIHWGIFKLSSDVFDEELNVLLKACNNPACVVCQSQVSVLKVGQRIQYSPLPVGVTKYEITRSPRVSVEAL